MSMPMPIPFPVHIFIHMRTGGLFGTGALASPEQLMQLALQAQQNQQQQLLMASLGITPPDTGAAAAPSGGKGGGTNTNLFIYHVPNTWDDNILHMHFAPHGTIVSATVMKDRVTVRQRQSCVGAIGFCRHIIARSPRVTMQHTVSLCICRP